MSDHDKPLVFQDNEAVREVVGELGAHLAIFRERLGVAVHHRGSEMRVESLRGDPEMARTAAKGLKELYALARQGHRLRPPDVHHAVGLLKTSPDFPIRELFNDVILLGVKNRRITPRSVGQREYVKQLRENTVCFGVGPAGTGKTYLAMAMAVAALKEGSVERIILTRPAVEAGEKLGFLPGDLTEKVDPYLRPLYDALADMVPRERLARLLDKQVIEIAPLAFMRGRTLDKAYVVLDEGQNTTRAQMKMFLTRLGSQGRMVITGDVTQIDLPTRQASGMVEALRVLQDVKGIGFGRLSAADVVRHPLVADIIEAYDQASQRGER